uniref:3-hydroxyisobutyryl-CoA hydrolase n=2 Tax=Heterosigma akashiwo TaxID=2829 RepID=A0A7S4D921_HETAK
MLRNMSPTSLKVTHQMLKEGAKLKSLRDCLRMEFGVVQACMRPGGDFYEGVRAVLVDKDRRPQWRPGTLEEVPPDAVAGFFDRSGLEDDSLLRGPPPRRGEGSGAATAGGIARL